MFKVYCGTACFRYKTLKAAKSELNRLHTCGIPHFMRDGDGDVVSVTEYTIENDAPRCGKKGVFYRVVSKTLPKNIFLGSEFWLTAFDLCEFILSEGHEEVALIPVNENGEIIRGEEYVLFFPEDENGFHYERVNPEEKGEY